MEEKNKLKTIFTHEGDDGEEIHLQYDRKNNLYVNGNLLLTKKKISLRGYELLLLTLTTIGILIQSIPLIPKCWQVILCFFS
ncbi:hypothetical protein IZU94_16185 [Legionella sp. 27fs60]|nr:hypothetical protein [Legionella bononiensis]